MTRPAFYINSTQHTHTHTASPNLIYLTKKSVEKTTQDAPMTTGLSFNESQCKNCSIVYDTRAIQNRL